MATDPNSVTSTFVVRLMRDSTGVSGVVERVRTGVKHRFESVDALHRIVDEMLSTTTEEES